MIALIIQLLEASEHYGLTEDGTIRREQSNTNKRIIE